ncbi:MAG: LacI family DNA-binding transcriptional regulator [Candidatus Sumerlaeota bacterium]|nr:LacI family DNA-binding transcriptional regulator [Candidatus Sumerlaeota bacterium]
MPEPPKRPAAANGARLFRRATIADVAQLAGVSTTAVSFVVNERDQGIPKDTRQRILEAARKLHYRPHALIRGLKARRTHVFGLFCQDQASLHSPQFSTFALGLARGCRKTGYDVLVYRNSRDPEIADPAQFLDGRIDGLLFWGRTNEPMLQELGQLAFPAIALFNPEPPEGIDALWADDRKAYGALLDQLLDLGHRRFAFFHGKLTDPVHLSRWNAFRQAASAKGLELSQVQKIPVASSARFAQCPDPLTLLRPDVTAVFARDDLQAGVLLHSAARRGIRVPERLSFIGYDAFSIPVGHKLVTTRTPLYEIGVRAATQLDALIVRGAGALRREALRVEIVAGETIGPAPAVF